MKKEGERERERKGKMAVSLKERIAQVSGLSNWKG